MAGTSWWRRRAAPRRTRCGTTTSARTRGWSSRTARTSRTWSPARSAERSAPSGGSGRSPRIRPTRTTSAGPRARYRSSCLSRPPGPDTAPRPAGAYGAVALVRGAVASARSARRLAVDRAHTGQDGLAPHVDGSGVRARFRVERGVRGVILVRRVDPQHDRRVHGIAPRRRGHLRVAVLQYRVGGRARREHDGAGGDPAVPARGAAELVPVAANGGDAGETVHRAGAMAQVGELERVVDGAGRTVPPVDRDPAAEAGGGASRDGGPRRAGGAR